MAEYNITKDISHEFDYADLPVITISFLGAVLNTLLLFSFIKDPLKCFRNSATYLVMNLAVSDCFACLFAAVHHAINIGATSNYNTLQFFILVFGNVSLLSIASISLDRFLMVTYPMKHRFFMKNRAVGIWLPAIWILSCVIPVCTMKYEQKRRREIGIYILGAIVGAFSAVMYASIFHKLRKQSRKMASHKSSESRTQEIRIMKEKRFLKTIIIVAAIVFFCIVPSMIFYEARKSIGWKRDSVAFTISKKLFTFVFYANFAVNPLIYATRLPNYRRTFHLLFWKKVLAFF